MKIRRIFYLLLLMPIFGYSQNYKEDFAKILEIYSSQNMSMRLTYNYYNDYKKSTPDSKVKAELHVLGKLYYQKIGDVEIMRTPSLLILADHLNKYLNLDSAYNTGLTKNNQRTILDSVINYYKDITKYEVGALVQYKITALAPGISHSLLTVDPTNWKIKSIEIFFLDNRNNAKPGDIRNKLLIVYDQMSQPCQYGADYFNDKNYLITIGNKHKATSKYKNYTFINNIQ